MSLFKKTTSQFKNNYKFYLSVYISITLFLYGVSVFSGYYDVSVAYFMRDPVITLYGHPFVGAVSNLGILVWCATAAICFFCAVIHKKNGDSSFSFFLWCSGIFTSILMLDDFFMFHEYLFPYTFGIPQTAVIICYIGIALLYFVKFRGIIYASEYLTLLLACTMFSVSILSDIFMDQSDFQFLLEDGAKLLGIVTWFIYFSRVCYFKSLDLIKGAEIN